MPILRQTPQQMAEYFMGAFGKDYQEDALKPLNNLKEKLEEKFSEKAKDHPGRKAAANINSLLQQLMTLKQNENSDNLELKEGLKRGAEQNLEQLEENLMNLGELYMQEGKDKDNKPSRDIGEKNFIKDYGPDINEINKNSLSKSGAQWIEEVQREVDKDGTVSNDQLAKIIAVRHLSDAVRGNAANLKNRQISALELNRYMGKLTESRHFRDFCVKYRKDYNVKDITKGHGGMLQDKLAKFARREPELNPSYDGAEIDPLFSRYISPDARDRKDHVAIGKLEEVKTGAQIIEGVQNTLKSGKKMNIRDLLTIIAARQLSGAVRNKKDNLTKTYISPDELGTKIGALMNDPAYSKFRNRVNEGLKDDDYDDIIRKGHAGGIEDIFNECVDRAYDVSSKDRKYSELDDMNDVLMPENNTYAKYFANNRRDFASEKHLEYLDSIFEAAPDREKIQMTHAAKMAAALKLSTEKKENRKPDKFNEQELLKTAKQIYDDPAFKLACRNKKAMQEMCNGRPNALMDKVNEINRKFSEWEDADDMNLPGFNELCKKISGETKILEPKHQDNIEKSSALYEAALKAEIPDNVTGKRKLLLEKRAEKEALEKAHADELEKVKAEAMSSYGPKHQAMLKALDMHRKGPNPSTAMNLVDKIVDYQTGKEKGFRSEEKNRRFDESMELLGRLTRGTEARDIFLAQVKKVNDARGLKPGDAGYRTAESYLPKIRAVSLKGKLFNNGLDNEIGDLEAEINEDEVDHGDEEQIGEGNESRYAHDDEKSENGEEKEEDAKSEAGDDDDYDYEAEIERIQKSVQEQIRKAKERQQAKLESGEEEPELFI